MFNKEVILGLAGEVLGKQIDALNDLESISIRKLDPKRTLLVVIDMVNGFAKKGALYSPRIEALIPEIKRVMEMFMKQGFCIVSLADCHHDNSPEFKRYPKHCVYNSKEYDVVDEFFGLGQIIDKNSTNGYLEGDFQEYLRAHPEIDTFVVVGDCTDICIAQFATTAKADFDRKNRDSEVIVLTQGVDTFSIPGAHDGDFYQILGLTYMASNGIKLAKTIVEEKYL